MQTLSTLRNSGALLIVLFAFGVISAITGIASARHSAAESGAPTFALAYLEDPSGELTLADILARENAFADTASTSPNFGFTQSAYWFHIQAENSDPENHTWLLEIAYPVLDQITLYDVDSSGNAVVHSSGDHVRLDERDVSSRNPVFKVDIPTGAPKDYYLRVHSDSSMQVPVRFWSQDCYASNTQTEYMLLGLYFGILLALLVYNLMLIIWIQDVVYFHYAGYLLTFSVFQLALTGLAFQYLWPDSAYLNDHAVSLFLCLSAFFSTFLAHSLLQIPKNAPKHHRPFMGLAFFFLLMTPFSLVADYQTVMKTLTFGVFIGSLYYLYVATLTLRSGVSTAKYFLMARSVFLVSVVLYSLTAQGLLPIAGFAEYALQFGSALEATLVSLALAHRFKVIKDNAAKIQAEAKDTMELRVNERTLELKTVLEELTVANARLQGLNNTDPMTGINNRAFFESHIEYAWNNAARATEYLSIMMVDVDHFKSINDNFGHLIGDEVLVAIAQKIRKSLTRTTDQVARYGGEEFVAVLSSTDLEGALQVAERVRANVEAMDPMEFGLDSGVTVSIGVSTLSPATTPLSLRDFIAQADTALYSAKHQGRNRVVAFDPDPDAGAAPYCVSSYGIN